MFDAPLSVKCTICGKIGAWECTIFLLSDPPIATEPQCPDCIAAVTNCAEQKRYLKKYHAKKK